MGKIKLFFLFVLLFVQYIITFLFKSDIPMIVDNEEIICTLVITNFIQAIIMFINDDYMLLLKTLIILLIVWLIDTIHLLFFSGDKSYILNIIGLCTVIFNLLYCIYRMKMKQR